MSTDDKSQKTEEPTEHKLRQSREKGQVAKSKEIVSAAGIVSIIGTLWAAWDYFQDLLIETFTGTLDLSGQPFDEALPRALDFFLNALLFGITPFIALALIVGIIANVSQFGFLFAPEAIKPKPEKLNPVQGLKNMFAAKKLIETLKATVKLVVLGTVAVYLVRYFLRDLVLIPYCGFECAMLVGGRILELLLFAMIPLFIVIAALDLKFQKQQHIKDNRMTKDEVKRDNKETQGDPLVKQERKSRQRETAEQDLKRDTERSTVILIGKETAVGMRYVEGETGAPIITLKEKKRVAARIVQMARDRDIPVVHEPQLVDTLWEKGEIDQIIPTQTFDEIARVIMQTQG